MANSLEKQDVSVQDYHRFTGPEKSVRQFYWIAGLLLCFIGLLVAFFSEAGDITAVLKGATAAIVGAIFLGIGNVMDLKAALRQQHNRGSE